MAKQTPKRQTKSCFLFSKIKVKHVGIPTHITPSWWLKLYFIILFGITSGMFFMDLMTTHEGICGRGGWEMNMVATSLAYKFGYGGMATILFLASALSFWLFMWSIRKGRVSFWTALAVAMLVAVFLGRLNASGLALLNNLELLEYLEYGTEPNPAYIIQMPAELQQSIQSSFSRDDFCRMWRWPL